MGRPTWDELPPAVRSWAESVRGSAVVREESRPGGFSPGAASRLRFADGSRAFLKAVSADANPDSPGLHRREAAVTAALPAAVPAPRLLGCYDDGTWVALLLTDIAGRHPAQPWQLPELERVIAALDGLHALLTPPPLAARPVTETHRSIFAGWRALAAAGSAAGLDDWSARNLSRLGELESAWEAAAAGDTLLHCDVRADNILLSGGRVLFVDWPHASIGVPWFDVIALAPSVALQGGPEPEWLLGRSGTARQADPDAVTAVLAAVAGYFTRSALLPAPPGLPTVRAFQRAQGIHALRWLRQRTGWP